MLAFIPLLLVLICLAFTPQKTKTIKPVATAAPSYQIVMASLKDSPTWRMTVLGIATKIAAEKYVQFYNSTNETDQKRAAFAKKLLTVKSVSDVILIQLVNQVTNDSVIGDLNDSYTAIENIRNKIDSDFDVLAGIIP